MHVEISFTQAIDLTDLAISQKGATYIYPKDKVVNCCYFYQGEPSCLVGQILFGMGFDLDESWGSNEEGVGSLFESDVIGADVVTQCYLNELQSQQDRGVNWAQAKARAVEKARYVYREDPRRCEQHPPILTGNYRQQTTEEKVAADA